MKIRIHISQKIELNAPITLDNKNTLYLKNTLRLKQNDTIFIFNDINGEYEARVISAQKTQFTISPIKNTIQKPNPKETAITMAFCLTKPSYISSIINNCTQCGISNFIPIKSTFSPIPDINIQRLQKIAIEATEQSNQLSVPTVQEILKFRDFTVSQYSNSPKQHLIFFNETAPVDNTITNAIQTIKSQDTPTAITLLIGSEGGFSEEEKQSIKKIPSHHEVSLGATILKSELAAPIATFITTQAFS